MEYDSQNKINNTEDKNGNRSSIERTIKAEDRMEYDSQDNQQHSGQRLETLLETEKRSKTD